MNTSVRRATPQDVEAISTIHRDSFPRQIDSKSWVGASLAGWPRILAYVLTSDTVVAGYIFWAQKSGIRPAAILELDQVAVQGSSRGRGLGTCLIRDSLSLVEAELAASGQFVKSILVSTRSDNQAMGLYSRILGAKVVATIDGLFAVPEVLMVAHHVDA